MVTGAGKVTVRPPPVVIATGAAGYMDRCAADAGHLVVFDRSGGRSWDEKVFHHRHESAVGADIHVWGM